MKYVRFWQVWATLMAVGCATTPNTMRGERAAQDAEKCLRVGPCFVVQATNDGSYAMVVRLNGVKIGEVTAWGKATFFVRESALRDGRCASVSIYLTLHGGKGNSDRQCIDRGGFFILQLDNQNRIWLVPRMGE